LLGVRITMPLARCLVQAAAPHGLSDRRNGGGGDEELAVRGGGCPGVFRSHGTSNQRLISSVASAAVVAEGVRTVLLDRHDGEEDFTIATQTEMLGTLDRIRRVVSLAVGGIGAISLLVGAIGILTMMVSVL